MSLRGQKHTQIPVWIRLKYLPMEYWTDECLSTVASGVGTPLYTDGITKECSHLDFARVCVMLDFNSELPKHLVVISPVIRNGKEDPKRVNVEYEWLPQRCKNYCSLGHMASTCLDNMKRNIAPPITIFIKKQSANLDSVQPEQSTESEASPKTTANPVCKNSSLSFVFNRDKEIVLYNSCGALDTDFAKDAELNVDDDNQLPGPNKCSPTVGVSLSRRPRGIQANVQRTRRNLLQGWSWFEDYSGPAGRIWLAWYPLEVGVEILTVEPQFIHCRAFNKRMHTRSLISVRYGDYDIIPRRDLWGALRTLSTRISDEPWLVLGDFNAVNDDSEVCGRAADTSVSMAEFRNCIRDTGLVQLPFTGCPFTCHNCSEGTRSLWKRLDRMLVNEAWLDVWPGSSYLCTLPSTSDHSPLILTGTNRDAEHAIFRFDNYLAHQPGFLDSVENIWKHRISGTSMYEIVCKLKLLKAEFRRQKKMKGNLTENVKKAKKFLDKAQALFTTYKEDILLNLVKCCRRVYSEAVKLEISMLQQRAKLRWMKHGDQNSKVFFRKINSIRVKQRVFQITKARGEILTEQQDVTQEFISYFQTLLGDTSPHRVIDLGFLRHYLKHTLTTGEANLLVAPVTQSEVKEAIFDIDVESAPGPDGYTSAFYRAAWTLVGQAIFEAVGEFFRTAITKIIVKRIQLVLPLLIDYSQNAFVPGRSISDNILIAQELHAGYNQVRLPHRCTLKVDIQKAYDSVEWDFLLEPHFPYRLMDRSMVFSKAAEDLDKALAQQSGRSIGRLEPSEPILCLKEANRPGKHGGSANNRKTPPVAISKIQSSYARDCHDFSSQATNSRTIGTGNPSHTDQALRSFHMSDCRMENSQSNWLLVTHSNNAGRLQLLKSVLSTLHTYWASVFILPKGVLKILEKKMRKFLLQGPSGRGNAKVAWEQICKPKEEGGLGIRSLIATNQALILKHLWRILQNDGTSIWVDWFSITGSNTHHFGHSMVQQGRGAGRK
ncbi:hypothetical protein Sango_2797500 [Sesamum angolense]|uniref:Endonuclease/exonuclease/phosphatase domain-containing protein n=1 Tax=Sesamum angolense TaxID=2727404 RepID=A0AAE1VWZ8_9LAMI|nr:hypothetical protein Sango_2797500 [Sesamum angolense]